MTEDSYAVLIKRLQELGHEVEIWFGGGQWTVDVAPFTTGMPYIRHPVLATAIRDALKELGPKDAAEQPTPDPDTKWEVDVAVVPESTPIIEGFTVVQTAPDRETAMGRVKLRFDDIATAQPVSFKVTEAFTVAEMESF